MRDQILKMLQEIRPEFDFSQKVNFIEEGMLDSFDVMTLMVALDEYYNISIDGLDIISENFTSIDAIVKLLIRNGVK